MRQCIGFLWWFNCFQDNETFLCPWWKQNLVYNTNEFVDLQSLCQAGLDLSLPEYLILPLPRVVLSSCWHWVQWLRDGDQWERAWSPLFSEEWDKWDVSCFSRWWSSGPRPPHWPARPDTTDLDSRFPFHQLVCPHQHSDTSHQTTILFDFSNHQDEN